MKYYEVLAFLIGLGLCLLGGFLLFVSFSVFSSEPAPHGPPNGLVGGVTLLMGIVPFLLGVWLCIGMPRRGRRRIKQSKERVLLQLAQKHGGRLTVADVATETTLPSAAAKRVLDQSNLDGLAEMHVSDSGAVVYTFHVAKTED